MRKENIIMKNKKILLFICVLSMLALLCGCGKKSKPSEGELLYGGKSIDEMTEEDFVKAFDKLEQIYEEEKHEDNVKVEPIKIDFNDPEFSFKYNEYSEMSYEEATKQLKPILEYFLIDDFPYPKDGYEIWFDYSAVPFDRNENTGETADGVKYSTLHLYSVNVTDENSNNRKLFYENYYKENDLEKYILNKFGEHYAIYDSIVGIKDNVAYEFSFSESGQLDFRIIRGPVNKFDIDVEIGLTWWGAYQVVGFPNLGAEQVRELSQKEQSLGLMYDHDAPDSIVSTYITYHLGDDSIETKTLDSDITRFLDRTIDFTGHIINAKMIEYFSAYRDVSWGYSGLSLLLCELTDLTTGEVIYVSE